MPLRSVCPELLVRHSMVTLARYLAKAGIEGSLHSNALVLNNEGGRLVEEAVCYFAVEATGRDSASKVMTCMMVVLRMGAPRADRIISVVHHESDDPDLLDCPLEIIDVLTATACSKGSFGVVSRCLGASLNIMLR